MCVVSANYCRQGLKEQEECRIDSGQLEGWCGCHFGWTKGGAARAEEGCEVEVDARSRNSEPRCENRKSKIWGCESTIVVNSAFLQRMTRYLPGRIVITSQQLIANPSLLVMPICDC